MGCGSSKSTSTVAPMPMPEAWSPSTQQDKVTLIKVKGSLEESKAPPTGIITVKEVAPAGSCDSLPLESQYSSSESITKSASSIDDCRKGSAKSVDSGLGRERTDIITEKSDPALKVVAHVPENMPNHADLAIDGTQMKIPGPLGHRKRSNGRLPPIHPTGKHRVSQENQITHDPSLEAILQKHVQFADVLINELPSSSSIVKRPVSRGGVAFDIGTDERRPIAPPSSRKPPCVLKYSQQRRAADMVTHAELDEKQKAADQRRKEQEQMRLERIWAQQAKDKQVADALAMFAAMQTGLNSEKAERVGQSKTESKAGLNREEVAVGPGRSDSSEKGRKTSSTGLKVDKKAGRRTSDTGLNNGKAERRGSGTRPVRKSQPIKS